MGVLSDNRSQIVNGGLISASFVSDLYDVLTGNTLESVSISGSVNITGSLIGNLTGTADTASYVVTAQTASYVTTAQTASYVLNAVSSSFATSASYVLNAVSSSFATSASFATTASYSLVNVISSSSLADSSSFAPSASFATTSATASYLNDGSLYSETTISSANILALDNVQLLTNAPANGYYDVEKIIFEFNYGTTQYSISTPNALVLEQGSDMGLVSDNLITAAKDKIVILSSFNPYNEDVDGAADNQNTAVPFDKGSTLNLYWYSGGTPSVGDGTILVKVWYKVRTIGTEL